MNRDSPDAALAAEVAELRGLLHRHIEPGYGAAPPRLYRETLAALAKPTGSEMVGRKFLRKYVGLTHDVRMGSLKKWRREKCPDNVHCFDEVGGIGPDEHYLSCDACGLMVHIAAVETTYVEPLP
jgi:hypothetical protein